MARKVPAKPAEKPVVRLSVPLSHETWVKLITASAMKGVDRSVFAADILTRAVSGITIMDRSKDSITDSTDSPA
jgi:hypothetical protein